MQTELNALYDARTVAQANLNMQCFSNASIEYQRHTLYIVLSIPTMLKRGRQLKKYSNNANY